MYIVLREAMFLPALTTRVLPSAITSLVVEALIEIVAPLVVPAGTATLTVMLLLYPRCMSAFSLSTRRDAFTLVGIAASTIKIRNITHDSFL